MSDDSNIYSVDNDYNAGASAPFAATSGRIGSAPLASQGARVVAGYDANTLLAPFRLDAGGSLRTAPSNPGGGSVYVYNGQPVQSAASSQYGQQIMAQQKLPTPIYLPLQLDPSAALQCHLSSKVTARYIQPSTAGGAAGKSMFSLFNGSSATIVRVQQVNVQTPYLYATGQQVLGLGGTYNQSVAMYMEMRRITGHTKGASTATVGYAMADNADAAQLDPNIVAYSNATVTGTAATAFHRADTNSPSGLPWYLRGDPNQKTLVLRPGEGMTIVTVTNTSSIVFELEIVITVALG